MKKLYLLILLFNLSFSFSQERNNGFQIVYRYENHSEFEYLKKIDSISFNLLNNTEKYYLNPNYEYINDTQIVDYKNLIISNYWINSKVNFVFENDNLSFMSKDNFDKFRRSFYQNKNLSILISVNDNYKYKKNLKKITYRNYNIGILKLENFISATFYDNENERFLQFYYFTYNNQLIKVICKELNAHYNWDLVNNSSYYYKNGELIYSDYYQTLMDGRFSLETRYKDSVLYKLSIELLEIINQ